MLRKFAGYFFKRVQMDLTSFFVVPTILAGAGQSMFGKVVSFVVAKPVGFIILGHSLFFGPVGGCLLDLMDRCQPFFPQQSSQFCSIAPVSVRLSDCLYSSSASSDV